MYIVAKSGAPPSSCRNSAASDSIPPSGQSDVNSGHSMAISYTRPGYGFGNVSRSSGLGMPEDRLAPCDEAMMGTCSLVVGCRFLVVGCRFLAVGCRFLAVGCRFLAVGCRFLAVGC